MNIKIAVAAVCYMHAFGAFELADLITRIDWADNEQEIMALLQKRSKDEIVATKKWGLTLDDIMIKAASIGTPGIIKILVEKGFDVNQKDIETGDTPLQRAIRANKPNMIQILLENGAILDVNHTNKDDETYLHTAAFAGNIDMVKKFVEEYNMPIDHKTVMGTTPLYEAVLGAKQTFKPSLEKQQEVIRYLLDRGADPKVENIEGITLMELAHHIQQPTIQAFLQKEFEHRGLSQTSFEQLVYDFVGLQAAL